MNRIRNILNIDEINNLGLWGNNISIAYLDTGISKHTDLANRILAFEDVVNNKISIYDDNGHGTHVAGIAAGNGRLSNGLYRGIAPGANIVMVKCLDHSGNGKVESAVKGIEFIIKNIKKYNIRIVNISVGAVSRVDDKENITLMSMVEKMWEYGLVVVAAAGNNGPDNGSITAPGCSKSIITVGSCDDEEEVLISKSIRIKNYSGRGPTQVCVMKPEIISYGSEIISCSMKKPGYSKKSGTSMATPTVSGIIALLIEKYQDISNKEIKRKLYNTSIDLGYPKEYQGWGLINPKGLLEIE